MYNKLRQKLQALTEEADVNAVATKLAQDTSDFEEVKDDLVEEDEMADVRKHMIFHGRVQGVGFRYTAKYLARSMNLTGWVKNESDGTVVMEVQGREAMIFELMKGLNRNQFIQIDWIDTEEKETETESSFEVKY